MTSVRTLSISFRISIPRRSFLMVENASLANVFSTMVSKSAARDSADPTRVDCWEISEHALKHKRMPRRGTQVRLRGFMLSRRLDGRWHLRFDPGPFPVRLAISHRSYEDTPRLPIRMQIPVRGPPDGTRVSNRPMPKTSYS